MKHLKVLTKKSLNRKSIPTKDDLYAYEACPAGKDYATCTGGALDKCTFEDHAACYGSGSKDQCYIDYSACYSGGSDEGCIGDGGEDWYACGPGELDNCDGQTDDMGPTGVCDDDHYSCDAGCDW